MATAPDTSTYILVSPDPINLPNARTLAGGTNLALQDTGIPDGTLTIEPVGNLGNLAALNNAGYVVYDAGSTSFVSRTFTAGQGIAFTNAAGQLGNTNIAVEDGVTIQKVQVSQGGTIFSTRSNLNFVGTGGSSITIGDNGGANRTDITINTPVVPDHDATYIVQTADISLPNAQALNEVATGLTNYLAKVHTASGVISAAAPDVDYVEATPVMIALNNPTYTQPTPGSMLQGAGSFFVTIPIGSAGSVLTSNGTGFDWELPPGSVQVLAPTTVSVNLQPDITYVATSTTGLVTFHLPLPLECVPGQTFGIEGFGSSGWRLNAGISLQTLYMGSLQTTDAGNISSTSPSDAIEIICIDSETFKVNIKNGTPSIT